MKSYEIFKKLSYSNIRINKYCFDNFLGNQYSLTSVLLFEDSFFY